MDFVESFAMVDSGYFTLKFQMVLDENNEAWAVADLVVQITTLNPTNSPTDPRFVHIYERRRLVVIYGYLFYFLLLTFSC